MDMYAAKGEQNEELVFDDKAVLVESAEAQAAIAEVNDDSEQTPAENIDTLIADDSERKEKKK
jgi:hypothetical protein